MNGKIMENEWKMLDNEWEKTSINGGINGKNPDEDDKLG